MEGGGGEVGREGEERDGEGRRMLSYNIQSITVYLTL